MSDSHYYFMPVLSLNDFSRYLVDFLLTEFLTTEVKPQNNLNSDDLNKLEEITYQDLSMQCQNLSNKECAICLCNLKEDYKNHKYVLLECYHIYHSKCIKPYLEEYNNCCPTCRKVVNSK